MFLRIFYEVIKPGIEMLGKLLREAFLAIAAFLFLGPLRFLRDVLWPRKGRKRPWLHAAVGVLLCTTMLVSYSHVFHSWQVDGLKWLYVNSRLVRILPPDKGDWVKYFFKAAWVGHCLMALVSLGLTNMVWGKFKQKGNIVIGKGLKCFSKWTTDAIGEGTESVRLAVNTPLLHVFYDNPASENLSEYNGEGSTFEQHFCHRFLEGLRKCRDKNFKALNFLYLSPDVLKTVEWFPARDEANFERYNNSIGQFRNEVVTACARGVTTEDAIAAKAKDMFRETHMLPVWLAVITGKQLMGGTSAEAQTVVLGLTDEADLKKKPGNAPGNRKMKEFAETIAQGVMCLKCTDPEIVHFFDKVFGDLWDDRAGVREAILALLRQCRGGDFEVLLRQAYDADAHSSFRAGEPAHILYGTSRTDVEG